MGNIGRFWRNFQSKHKGCISLEALVYNKMYFKLHQYIRHILPCACHYTHTQKVMKELTYIYLINYFVKSFEILPFHFDNISSSATCARSAWMPPIKPQWYCFLCLLLMYCWYIYMNLNPCDRQRQAKRRMVLIERKRGLVMAHKEQGWLGR